MNTRHTPSNNIRLFTKTNSGAFSANSRITKINKLRIHIHSCVLIETELFSQRHLAADSPVQPHRAYIIISHYNLRFLFYFPFRCPPLSGRPCIRKTRPVNSTLNYGDSSGIYRRRKQHRICDGLAKKAIGGTISQQEISKRM